MDSNIKENVTRRLMQVKSELETKLKVQDEVVEQKDKDIDNEDLILN